MKQEVKTVCLRALWSTSIALLVLGIGIVMFSFVREVMKEEQPKTVEDEEVVAAIGRSLSNFHKYHGAEIEDPEDIWLTNTIPVYRYLPDGTLREEPRLNRRLLLCAGRPITYIVNFTQVEIKPYGQWLEPEEPLVQAWYDGAETLLLLEKDGDWLIADGEAALLRSRSTEWTQNRNCGELEDAQAVVEAAASVTGVVMEQELHVTLP